MRLILPHVGLVLITALYTLVGATGFYFIESQVSIAYA